MAKLSALGLRTAGRQIVGLFVDDGSLAVAILLWLLGCGAALPLLPLPLALPPVILFAGLAAILIESAVRRARRGP